MDCLRISATLCSLTGFMLLLTALSTDYWVYEDFHMGLWKICRWDEECDSLGMDVEGYIHATRAFMLMAIIPGSVSVIGLCFSYFRPHVGSISLASMVLIANLAAVLCTMVAMLTFTAGYVDLYNQMQQLPMPWSSLLCGFSFAPFILTGYLAFIAAIKGNARETGDTVIPLRDLESHSHTPPS